MVRVVSCRFLRLSCSEEDHPLFRREYARSNRERGVKLLRCFPHCCPEHARRSYCGCSVHVLVTFSSSVSAAELDDLIVCARFEPSRVAPRWPAGLEHLAGLVRRDGGSSAADLGHGHDEIGDDSRLEDERRLRAGESVVLPASLFSSSGRRSSMESVWIRADRESDAKQRSVPENSVLYVVNNCRFPKWYYNYDSSVTRTQRDMTHHFVAYALQLSEGGTNLRQRLDQQRPDQVEALQQQQQELTTSRQAVVLASVASPSFLLISFRRSGSAIVAGNAAAASAATDSSRCTAETATTSKPNPQVWVSRHHHSKMSPNAAGEIIKRRQRLAEVDTQRRESAPASRRRNDNPHVDQDGQGHIAACDPRIDDDDTLWLHQLDADFSDRAQQLVILWRFLQHLTLHELRIGEGLADMDLDAYLVQVKDAMATPGGQLEDAMHHFLRDLFGGSARVDPARVSFTDRPGEQALSDRDDNVIRVAAHCFLRVLSSRTVQRRLHSEWTVQDDVPTKEQLHEQFVSMVSSLYDAVEDDLRETATDSGLKLSANGSKCLPMLVDDVLSIVYGRTRFKVLRPLMSTLLMDLSTSGSVADTLNRAFQGFAAQAREAMIASAVRNHPIWRAEDGTAVQRTWNRRWFLVPSSMKIMNSGRDGLRDVLLVELAQLVCEFACLDVRVADDSRGLSLRSTLSNTSNESPWMDLVLDGHLRVFRVLPSGLSSMIPTAGGWSVGDYVAEFTSDMEKLYVDLFAFADDIGAAGDGVGVATRRVSLSITLEHAFSSRDALEKAGRHNLALSINGTVSSSTFGSSQVSRRGGNDDLRLSAMPSSRRARHWEEMEWIPVLEVQARYVSDAHQRSKLSTN